MWQVWQLVAYLRAKAGIASAVPTFHPQAKSAASATAAGSLRARPPKAQP